MKEDDFQVCTCIAIDCWHKEGACEEPPTMRGGRCRQCKTHVPAPKCPTCGQVVPK